MEVYPDTYWSYFCFCCLFRFFRLRTCLMVVFHADHGSKIDYAGRTLCVTCRRFAGCAAYKGRGGADLRRKDHQRHQLSRHGDWIFFSLTMVCEKTQGCKVLGQAILSKQFITIPSGWWFCDVLWWCLWAWRLLQRKAQMLPQAVHVTDMGFMGFRTSRTRSHQVGAIK